MCAADWPCRRVFTFCVARREPPGDRLSRGAEVKHRRLPALHQAAKLLGCQVFMDAGSVWSMELRLTAPWKNPWVPSVSRIWKSQACVLSTGEGVMPRDADDVLSSAVFSVYGKGDHPWSIISHADKGVAGGKTVSLSACRHRWNFMDIADASRAVVELYRYSDGHRGECCAVNVASEDTRVLRDFVEKSTASAAEGENWNMEALSRRRRARFPSARSMKRSKG